MKIKLIALFLAMIMLISVFAGCADSTTDNSSSQPTDSSSASSEESEENNNDTEKSKMQIPEEVLANPIFKETPSDLEYAEDTSPITFTIFYNTVVSDPWTWGEDAVSAEILKHTGVTLEGTYASDSDSNELTLMIASGSELPDFITGVSPSSVQYTELLAGDLVYPINELMDQYAPKMYDVMFDLETSYYTQDDGNFYGIGKQTIFPGLTEYGTANGWFSIRQDIYEELGSPKLKNIDDLWNYLELWEENKENWPEIKYAWMDPVLSGSGNISVAYSMLGGKAQYSSGSTYIYNSEDQTVSTVVDTELGKEALHFYWEMAQKGYITEASFSSLSFTDELSAGSALVFAKPNVWETTVTVDALAENIADASYSIIEPICEDDVDYHYYDAAFRSSGSFTLITKNCHNPERAIKFFEFMATEYANLLVVAGVYGDHWTYKTLPNGNLGIQYTEAADEASERDELGIYNYNKYWWNLATNYDLMAAYSQVESGSIKEDIASYIERNVCFSAPNFVSFNSDSNESILQSQIESIIATYVTKIILSANEDAFESTYLEMINALYSSGLEDLQNAYADLCNDWVSNLKAGGVEFID